MILAKIENIQTAERLLRSAFYLAEKLNKTFGVAYFGDLIETDQIQRLLENWHLPTGNIFVVNDKKTLLDDFCEEKDTSFLLLQQPENSLKSIQKQLKACRNLRIPYLFFKNNFNVLKISNVLIPVGFLAEEIEKAQFGSAFGRFCGAGITILQANDYGSKAQTTVGKMKTLFDKFDFRYSVQKALKDSFKVDKEAVEIARKEKFDIVIVSASREYGLDDVIFGPKELHLVKKSDVPVLLINPRGDLYTLCD